MAMNVLVMLSGTASASAVAAQAVPVREVFPFRSMATVKSMKTTHRMVLNGKSRVGFVVDSGLSMMSSLTKGVMHAVDAVRSLEAETHDDAVESGSKPIHPVSFSSCFSF